MITAIENLGFDEWFRTASRDFLRDDFSLSRIIEVNKNKYKVNDGTHEIHAEVSGKFLFDAENSLDLPTVGDWVVIQAFDDYSLAIIHHILPRKSLLKRKEPGKVIDFQLIAANIDYGMIVQSADTDFNLNRLDRYLVMINESNITPIVLVSKIDLLSQSEITTIAEQLTNLKIEYFLISNATDEGIIDLKNSLIPGKTYCLLGSSGVGKTTLLNTLLGDNLFKVREVREKDGRGRHTTVTRQLVSLDSGSMFIDSPGMRELGNFDISTGLEKTFSNIFPDGYTCRFKDCTHTHEEGCAIIKAVQEGSIDNERYQNYIKIMKESAHYEMSHLDKKKKDKALGKILKNYKKQKIKPQ